MKGEYFSIPSHLLILFINSPYASVNLAVVCCVGCFKYMVLLYYFLGKCAMMFLMLHIGKNTSKGYLTKGRTLIKIKFYAIKSFYEGFGTVGMQE